MDYPRRTRKLPEIKMITIQPTGVVKYSNCISAEGYDLIPTSALDKRLKRLIGRLQSLSSEKCAVLLQCYYSQAHFDPEG